MWNRNGRELFYRSGGKMTAVDVATQPGFAAGKARMLFEGRYEVAPAPIDNYDVSPDGQRFLMIKSSESAESAPTQINVGAWISYWRTFSSSPSRPFWIGLESTLVPHRRNWSSLF